METTSTEPPLSIAPFNGDELQLAEGFAFAEIPADVLAGFSRDQRNEPLEAHLLPTEDPSSL